MTYNPESSEYEDAQRAAQAAVVDHDEHRALIEALEVAEDELSQCDPADRVSWVPAYSKTYTARGALYRYELDRVGAL